MPEDWKAAAFHLERTDPHNRGRSTCHEHSGPKGEPIDARIDINDETRKAIRELGRSRARARAK